MTKNMKKFNTILIFLLFNCAIFAQIKENRLIVKSYRARSSTTVEVSNKYGKIQIINWTKDSVRIEVSQNVQASTVEKLNNLKENISYDFVGNDYYITARTNFGSNYNSFLRDLAQFAESLISTDTKATIDYTIYMPEYLNLKITNKFGDIYIDEISGNVDINLSNGNLKAVELKGNSNINLTMSDADIKTLLNARLNTNYANLNINKSNDLNIDSKISTIRIEDIDILKLVSRKDKIYVNQLSQLFGEAYFSNIWLYNLDTKANFKVKYSNMNLESVKKGFKVIDFTSEYTDFNMFFEPGSSYSLDIVHKKSFVKYPSEISDLKVEPINVQNGEYTIFGTVGRGNAESKLRIQAVSGNINIFQK